MVNWRGAAGALAGGTLGYISGNIPGAIVGGKMGYRLSSKDSNMPASRSRSRGRSATRRGKRGRSSSTAIKSRSKSFSRRSSMSIGSRGRMSSLASAAARSVRNVSSNIETQAFKLKRKGKKVKFEGKKRRVVGVTKKFKKKVRAAMVHPAPLGYFTETTGSRMPFPGPGTQQINNFGFVNDGVAVSFDPISVMHAVMVLWFNFAPVENRTDIPTLVTDIISVANFKVFVENCYTQYTYKNCTARTVVLKLYDSSPKNVIPVSQSFSSAWAVALVDQQKPAGATEFNIGWQNAISNTTGDLYMTPNYSPQLKTLYDYDCTTVVLDAGKTYVHKVNGPQKKWYDYQAFKTTLGGTIPDISTMQKFVKQHTCVMYPDLVTATSGHAGGRFGAVVAPFGLAVETKNFFKLRMPEHVGFQYPTAGAGFPVPGEAIPLSKRGFAFAVKNWAVDGVAPYGDVEVSGPGDLPDAGTA